MTSANKFPNFFILGAAKAGTTSLFDALNQHPQVYFPLVKEPAFFCDDSYYARGLDWYAQTYYQASGGQPARGEATSRYLFWGEKVAARIHLMSPSNPPRFIIIFREPASLVHSFYWNSVREGQEDLELSQALEKEAERLAQRGAQLKAEGQILFAYSRIGLYAQQVKYYLDLFPRRQFLFLLTDDLKDFSALTKKMQNFLELDDYSADIKPVTSNSAALPHSASLHQWLRNRSRIKDVLKSFIPLNVRHRLKMSALEMNLKAFQYPALDPGIEARLRAQYRNEMFALESIIQRDLSAWHTEPA